MTTTTPDALAVLRVLADGKPRTIGAIRGALARPHNIKLTLDLLDLYGWTDAPPGRHGLRYWVITDAGRGFLAREAEP